MKSDRFSDTESKRRSAAYALRAYSLPPTIDSYQGHPFLAELDAKAQAEGSGRPPAAPKPAAEAGASKGPHGRAPAGAGGISTVSVGPVAHASAAPKAAAAPKATASAPQLMDLLSLDEVCGASAQTVFTGLRVVYTEMQGGKEAKGQSRRRQRL